MGESGLSELATRKARGNAYRRTAMEFVRAGDRFLRSILFDERLRGRRIAKEIT